MPFIPRWLKDHFQIKVAMFFLATMLWFLVVTEKSHEYTLSLPIEITNLKPEYILSAPIPTTADVKFVASGKAMLSLMFVQTPSIRISLASIDGDVSRHKFKHAITTELVLIPGTIEAEPLEVITPDSVLIEIDERIEAMIPVSPQVTIETAAGYTRVGRIQLDPEEVLVAGPKTAVMKLTAVTTESIELKSVKRNTEFELNLVKPDDFGVSIDPGQVQALLKVERIGERNFEGIPLTIKNQPWGRTVLVEPGSIDVQLAGAVSLLANLDPKDISAWVDHREANPRSANAVPVHVDLQPDIVMIKVIPEKVRMIVRRN